MPLGKIVLFATSFFFVCLFTLTFLFYSGTNISAGSADHCTKQQRSKAHQVYSARNIHSPLFLVGTRISCSVHSPCAPVFVCTFNCMVNVYIYICYICKGLLIGKIVTKYL